MSRLVFKPSVHLIATTVISSKALDSWARAEGFHDLLMEENSALGKIFASVDDDNLSGDEPKASIDRLAEFAGRHCYRAWETGREIGPYLQNIIESGHGSVLHHATMVFAISGVSRSLSLELLRHHAGADPSQESQRYVDAKDIRFVVPPLILNVADSYTEPSYRGTNRKDEILKQFLDDQRHALGSYMWWQAELEKSLEFQNRTIDRKRILEAARASLPNCAETRLVLTMNMRALRHICSLRGAIFADLEIRRLAVEFLRFAKRYAPHTFADFEIVMGEDGFETTKTPYPKV